jgi:hypothetical protein
LIVDMGNDNISSTDHPTFVTSCVESF